MYNQTPLSQTHLPPLNRTLQSMGCRNVIIINFKNPSSDNDTQARQLLADPIKLNQLIYSAPFGNLLEIIDIRPNLRKLLVAIENKQTLLDSTISDLTKIVSLGTHTVSCYLPNSDQFISGIINPISLHTDLDLLKDELNKQEAKVTRIERLKRRLGSEWVDTMSVKLTFHAGTLPEHISVFHIRYQIRPFIPNPMQCYYCQRLGHTSKSCKARQPRCMLCGGPHDKANCSSTTNYCVNCKGQHGANSKLCPAIRTAREVEKLRVEHKMDYVTARKTIMSHTSDCDQSSYYIPNSNRNPLSYASKAAQNKKTYTPTQRTSLPETIPLQMADASTQTDVKETNIAKHNENDFFLKLRKVLLEIVNINISHENKQTRTNLTDSAIINNFGIPLDVLRPDCNNKNDSPTETNDTERRKRKQAEISNEETSSAAEEDVLSCQESETGTPETSWLTYEKRQFRKILTIDNTPENKAKKRTKKKTNKKQQQ